MSLTCGLGLDRPIGLYSGILECFEYLKCTRATCLDLLTFSPVFFWSGFPTSLLFFSSRVVCTYALAVPPLARRAGRRLAPPSRPSLGIPLWGKRGSLIF